MASLLSELQCQRPRWHRQQLDHRESIGCSCAATWFSSTGGNRAYSEQSVGRRRSTGAAQVDACVGFTISVLGLGSWPATTCLPAACAGSPTWVLCIGWAPCSNNKYFSKDCCLLANFWCYAVMLMQPFTYKGLGRGSFPYLRALPTSRTIQFNSSLALYLVSERPVIRGMWFSNLWMWLARARLFAPGGSIY